MVRQGGKSRKICLAKRPKFQKEEVGKSHKVVAFVKTWNQIVVGLRKRRYARIAQSMCSLGKGVDSMSYD
jgi:hypothetical protein